MAVELNIRPSFREKYRGRQNALVLRSKSDGISSEEAQRDEQILRDMWWMIAVGLSVFLGGFGIWTLDNKYCSTLRRWRREVGLPWGILLEGHGWW
jgi:dihydroceramidase